MLKKKKKKNRNKKYFLTYFMSFPLFHRNQSVNQMLELIFRI